MGCRPTCPGWRAWCRACSSTPAEIELYEVDLSKVQRKEVNIRPVAEMLRRSTSWTRAR